MIRRGYPLFDDPPAHKARAAKRRWLKVLPTHGRKRAPRHQTFAFKKVFCAFFIFCAVPTTRTPHEPQIQSTRITSVIYFTKAQHDGAHITPANAIKMKFTDATTRENFPEASPKGPGSKHFMALAEQRPFRTLGTQGLASRLLEPDKKALNRKQNLRVTKTNTT